jgi:hypothetical protein
MAIYEYPSLMYCIRSGISICDFRGLQRLKYLDISEIGEVDFLE